MRRVLTVFAVICMLTLQVFAYDMSNLTYEDGNTVLGTFITSTMKDSDKEEVREWLNGDLSLIVYVPSKERYLLLNVSTADSMTVTRLSNGLAKLYFPNGARGIIFDIEDSNLTYAAMISFSSTTSQSDCVIIGGKYFSTCDVTLPTPTSTYVADIKGSLMLRDDGGLMSDEDKESGGILGFLKGFWDSLANAFISLFVPSDDFFSSYFEEIRSSASVKMGGLLSLYNAMLDAFQSLNGDTPTLKLEIPENRLFPSSPLISVNILENASTYVLWVKRFLTGFVVLFTAVVCYRRLVTLFEQ